MTRSSWETTHFPALHANRDGKTRWRDDRKLRSGAHIGVSRGDHNPKPCKKREVRLALKVEGTIVESIPGRRRAARFFKYTVGTGSHLKGGVRLNGDVECGRREGRPRLLLGNRTAGAGKLLVMGRVLLHVTPPLFQQRSRYRLPALPAALRAVLVWERHALAPPAPRTQTGSHAAALPPQDNWRPQSRGSLCGSWRLRSPSCLLVYADATSVISTRPALTSGES